MDTPKLERKRRPELLPESLRARLYRELSYAVEKMREEESPFSKLYYLSVFFSETNRVLNTHWDRDLLLLHDVVHLTHTVVSARLEAMKVGAQEPISMPGNIFDLLTTAAADLANFVETGGDRERLCEILGRFSELGYSTTGNGYYLFEKGTIKL